jgi:primosomal replication protein N
MNRLELVATVMEREMVRYTPAGIPMLGVLLQHQSSVTEAGRARQVQMTLPALVAGGLVDAVQRLDLGSPIRFSGFLAPKRQNARTLVFHITELQDIGKD